MTGVMLYISKSETFQDFKLLHNQVTNSSDSLDIWRVFSLRQNVWKLMSVDTEAPVETSTNISTTNASVFGNTLKAPNNTPIQFNVLGNPVNSTQDERQTSCKKCFRHNFKYIIQNDNICAGDSVIDLFVFILTIHSNVKQRNAIRDTWISPYKSNTRNVRYAFLLGEVGDDRQRQSVIEENSVHHDIVKEDFMDTYSNLTYKTIMGFKLVTTICDKARYVMKTDDDMFVNIPKLIDKMDQIGEQTLSKTIIGVCHQTGSPIRDKKSKWYASPKSFPQNSYPGFCSGTGYATSAIVVKEIYKISPHVPFFHLEDVYTAVCARKLHFALQAVAGFNAGRPQGDGCHYRKNIITSHQVPPDMLYKLWSEKCPNPAT